MGILKKNQESSKIFFKSFVQIINDQRKETVNSHTLKKYRWTRHRFQQRPKGMGLMGSLIYNLCQIGIDLNSPKMRFVI
jgi:hypothetical protein